MLHLSGIQTVPPSNIDATAASATTKPMEKPAEEPTGTSTPAPRGIPLSMKLEKRKVENYSAVRLANV